MTTRSHTDHCQPDFEVMNPPLFSHLTWGIDILDTNPEETQDRWYRHAEGVMCSIFCAEEDEHYDSWSERALRCEWNEESQGYPIDIVISKMRVMIEANEKRTPAVHRIRYMIWLGLLTSCSLEAEVLKWLACQEYLLYRCRGGIADFGVDFWLSALCKRAERALPNLYPDLSTRLPISGEVDGYRVEKLITDPDIVTCTEPILEDLTGKDDMNPLIEQETVAYLQELEHNGLRLGAALETFGTRLLWRRDELAAYRKKIDSIPTRQGLELDIIMSFLRSAQAGERNDLEVWRRLDMERQSILITIGRLQKLLGFGKKTNHNRNKNKNRVVRKKEKKKLQQDKGTAGQGNADNKVKAEEEPHLT